EKAPSMGWMFVPLTQYQGGGDAATIEPLEEHLDVYRTLMMQNYGAGAQACYRGPRLYDTDKTREMVSSVVAWYKKYREILNSDVIHLRRPDGRDWDGIMHVNPGLKEKGFVLLFNPLKENITRQLKLPLYYTGLHKTATLSDEKGRKSVYEVSRDYSISVEVTIPAQGMRWIIIE
ncbi:MAG: alpha-galactosidase, partial [Bacteroidota bacterium]